MKPGYKNVLYDRRTNKILVRRVGETKYTSFDYEDFYYIETKEKSDYKDCFGNYMKRVKGGSPETLDRYRKGGLKTAETDLKPVVKWLHEEYDSIELNHTAKDFRICYFDIEVQSGRAYPLSHRIKFRKRGTESVLENSIRYFEDVFNVQDYEVYDELEKKWRRYRGSCYFNSKFPSASLAPVPINLITCVSSIDGKTYTWGLEAYTGETSIENYRWFEDELEMLKDWLGWFHKQYFDIWTGWNSELYDIPYICNRLARISEERDIDKDFTVYLSPLNKAAIKSEKTEPKTGKVIGDSFEIPGLLTLDFLDAFKKFGPYDNLPSWKLDYVANITIGRKKLAHDELPFEEFYRKDYNYYVLYNRVDAELLLAMDKHSHIMDMVISFAHDCLIPLGKVYSMINTVTGYILRYIHSKHIVMNDRPVKKAPDWWHDEGYWKIAQPDGNVYLQNTCWEKDQNDFAPYYVKAGYVYAMPGRYSYMMSGDITSSYPHQIMMYNISPETKVIKPTKEQIDSGEVIRSEINGLGFRRTEDAILPSVVRKVFGEKDYYSKLKKDALKAGDMEAATVYNCLRTNKKLIANSIYGVCLNDKFNFFDIDCARAITRAARVCIRYIMDHTNRYYRHKQFLVDGMKEMPVINIKFDGKDHWLSKDELIEVKDRKTGRISKIRAGECTKDMQISPKSVEKHRMEVA